MTYISFWGLEENRHAAIYYHTFPKISNNLLNRFFSGGLADYPTIVRFSNY